MKKAIKVLRELGIALLVLAAAGVAMIFLFVNKMPIAIEIPEAEVYVKVDRNDFAVATNGIEDAQNETVVYESTTIDLETYTDELRYITGKTEPLTITYTETSDLPTEVIE